MKEKVISVAARILPDGRKYRTGKELAQALAKVDLSSEEAQAWYKDLQKARRSLHSSENRWHMGVKPS